MYQGVFALSLHTYFRNKSVVSETLRRCLCRSKKLLQTDDSSSGCAWRQVTALSEHKLGMPHSSLTNHDTWAPVLSVL